VAVRASKENSVVAERVRIAPIFYTRRFPA